MLKLFLCEKVVFMMTFSMIGLLGYIIAYENIDLDIICKIDHAKVKYMSSVTIQAIIKP